MGIKEQTLQWTKVERDVFLRTILQPYASSVEIEKAIDSEAVSSCIAKEIVEKAGKDCVRKRCFLAGGMSMATSAGGIVGTIALTPFDFAQFAYHAAKLSQELYYLFGKKHMFQVQKSEDIEVLLYMLAGAGGAITLSSVSLSAIGQWLYQRACKSLSLQAWKHLPYIGCVIHGTISFYALYSLAEEYREKLCETSNQHQEKTAKDIAKEIGMIIDVEYHVAEEKFHRFCNLEKLRQYYTFLEAGYINEQEFEQLKLDL